MLLQDPAKAFPALAEVHAYGRWAGPDDPCDLVGRIARVVVEDERGSLVRREPRQTGDQSRGRLLHLIAWVGDGWPEAPAILELSGSDPKRCPPDPTLRVPEMAPAADRLREGLGHGVAGHLSISGERNECAPQTSTVVPVELLEAALGRHEGILHHRPTGLPLGSKV